MTVSAKDPGGRWPTIEEGVSRDHRCLLLLFHFLHAVHAVPWKACCSLAPEQPDYDNEKKKIERRFTGQTKLSWEDIACYLNKLPEPTREHATALAFYLFKRWCEGSRVGRTVRARDEARHALSAAEAATAGRPSLPVAWLWLTPDAATSIPIMMTPDVATDTSLATSGPAGHSSAALVPRTDLEEVEHRLAIALEQAREAGDRAQEADERVTAVNREREEANRLRGGLSADVLEIGTRLIQAREDLAAAHAVLAQVADVDARAAQVEDRERAVETLETRTITRLSRAEERARQAEWLAEQECARAAHLAERVLFLEEQNHAVPVAPTPTPADAGQPGTGSRRRWWVDRRQDEVSRRLADENHRDQVQGQASLTAQLEATDRLRRELVDTVAHEFHQPLTEIRDALTAARDGQPDDSPLTNRLTAAVQATGQLERLLDSLVTATTVAQTDVNASDLGVALADVQRSWSASQADGGGAIDIDAPAHLPVRMDRDILYRLLDSLTQDALRAAAPGLPVHVGAGRVGDRILLRIRTPTRQFTPETDDPTAADLRYVIEQIVKNHGGHLRADIRRGNDMFDILDVELPAADLIPAAAPATMTVPGPVGQSTAEPPATPADDRTRSFSFVETV